MLQLFFFVIIYMLITLKENEIIFIKFKYLVDDDTHHLNLSFRVSPSCEIDPKIFLNLFKEKY